MGLRIIVGTEGGDRESGIEHAVPLGALLETGLRAEATQTYKSIYSNAVLLLEVYHQLSSGLFIPPSVPTPEEVEQQRADEVRRKTEWQAERARLAQTEPEFLARLARYQESDEPLRLPVFKKGRDYFGREPSERTRLKVGFAMMRGESVDLR